MRIKKFLELYESQDTIQNYKKVLKNYFSFIYPGMELEAAGDQYFTEKRNYEEDISKYYVSIKHRAPRSVQLYLSGVKTFLLENGVELPQQFWRRLKGKKKGSRALTQDLVLNNNQLRQILTHVPVHGKALFLTLATSGMRIGECLQLKLNDIDLESDPAKITIPGRITKTGNPRITYISKEAKEAIQEWLKVRERYLQQASGRSTRYKKSLSDDRLFPFEAQTAYMMWINALNKSGFNQRDKETNFHKAHVHTLRKFYRTRLGSVIPVDIVEALMGHEGYLTEVYRRYSEEELADFYKKGEHALLIFTNGAEISKLKVEIEERNKQLQTIINGLVAENLELKQRMSEFEKYKELLETLNNSEVKEVILKLGSSLKKS